MWSSEIFVILGVLILPSIIQGQLCPRTNKEPTKNCVKRECVLSMGCTGKRECICDGDCGYSCIKRGLTCNTPNARTLTNGRRVVNGRKFNDTVVFTCDPGFTLSGSSIRRCRGLGIWDGIEPKCGKKCDDPGVANNTLRREPMTNGSTKGVFKTSEVLHYYCNSGYLLGGKERVTCQVDGKWDSSPPKCYRTACPPPTLPANADVSLPTWFNVSKGGRNGQRLFLTCNPGYNKIGSSQMICIGKQWQISTSFKCLPVSCGDPGKPRNGNKIGLKYHFRSRVTFYCDECFKLIGASYRVCNADRSWSDKQPVCQRDTAQCKSISSFSNGMVSVTTINCGGTAKFSCDRDYKLIGSEQISCHKGGQWSDRIPRCEPVWCLQLNISRTRPGLKANISAYHDGSIAKFSCDEHYVLSGNDSISCKDNEWSGSVPECLAPCHIVESEKLISKQKTYEHGTVARLTCDPGYVVSGVINGMMPQCTNGTWQYSKFPYCAKEEDVKETNLNFRKKFRDQFQG